MICTKPVLGEQLGLRRITYVEEKAVYLTQPPSDSSRLFIVNEKGLFRS